MATSSDDILRVVEEIRDVLGPISACYEEQYAEVRRQRLEELQEILDPVRRRIFPLLFDERHLSMRAIAEEANSNHPKVGRFIRELVERGLLTRTEDDNGAVTYRDRFDLRDLLED